VPESAHVDELFADPSHKTAAFDWSEQLISWKNFFLALDRGFKLYEKLPWKPLRQRALREAKQWMVEHMDRSEGVAAIYPAMMNSIFALIALGHAPEDRARFSGHGDEYPNDHVRTFVSRRRRISSQQFFDTASPCRSKSGLCADFGACPSAISAKIEFIIAG